MNSLMAIEWLKIKKYSTFWVLAGLFLALMPLWNYEVAKGFIKVGGSGKGGINFLDTAYSFPQVWGNLGFWGSIFILFLSILVIILTSNEFTYRTHRQHVIDGWSRMQFYHAKVFLVLILSLGATVYLFLLGMLFGGVNSGSLRGLLSELRQLGYFFILSVDYMGFALFLSIWLRRSGLAIGLFLLYSFIIENIVRGIVNHFCDRPFGNLMPLQASDELLPFPLFRMAKSMMANGPTISPIAYAIVAVIWCVIYYLAGRYMLLKRDW